MQFLQSCRDLQYDLGFVLVHTSRPEEAIAYLQKAIGLDPNSDPPWFQMATALKELHQDDRAEKIFAILRQRKQRSVDKNVLDAQGNQANIFLQTGKPKEAADVYRHMLELNPNDAHTYYNL